MKRFTTYQLALMGLMAAITCILGPLSLVIPVSPVPVSLTNLAIYFSVFILGTKLGTVSCLIYLLLGLAGLPVFSGFSGGAEKLLGPTGGYLIGFIFMALISGIFIQKFSGRTFFERGMQVLGMILGALVLYAFGTAWLALGAGMSFPGALMAGVIPFIPFDLIKILLTAALAPEICFRLTRAGLLWPRKISQAD